MVSELQPLWPVLFAVAAGLLVIRQAISAWTRANLRLFLLLAACLFASAGFADLIIRLSVTGRW